MSNGAVLGPTRDPEEAFLAPFRSDTVLQDPVVLSLGRGSVANHKDRVVHFVGDIAAAHEIKDASAVQTDLRQLEESDHDRADCGQDLPHRVLVIGRQNVLPRNFGDRLHGGLSAEGEEEAAVCFENMREIIPPKIQ